MMCSYVCSLVPSLDFLMGLGQLLDRMLVSLAVLTWRGGRCRQATQFCQIDTIVKECIQQPTMAKALLSHQLCRFWTFEDRYNNTQREYRATGLAWIALVGFESLNDVDLISYQCSKFYAQMFASFFLIYYMLTITEYVDASGATKLMGGWSEQRSEGAILLSSFLR